MARRSNAKTGTQVLRDLEKGQPLAPVYYLHGDDPYQIRNLVSFVVDQVQPAFKDFNLHQVTGGEAPGEQIAALAQQLPVMDERTVVVVREASQLKKADWDALQFYLEDPSPTTCLVFLTPTADSGIDGRTKSGKLLKTYQVQCRKPYENRIPQWIQERSQSYDLRLGPGVVERLMDLLGTELSALDNALQRLALFIGGAGQVSLDVVNEAISSDRSYNVFELVKLVGNRQFEQALRYLRGGMARGEAPLKLLGLLAKTFRELLDARVLFDQGERSLQAFDRYINPKLRYDRNERIRAFLDQVSCFSRQELIRALQLMHQTDLSLKSTSGLTDELLMERLLFEMCLPTVPRAR
ncbi:MAG: DNA polymerase III subunit delta [Deltaproteobacteria bacterium]|nr:MAG: DNA polymerase III subunit delta [Deltaproteobacteria bacterium]